MAIILGGSCPGVAVAIGGSCAGGCCPGTQLKPNCFGNAAIAWLDCLPNTDEFPMNTYWVLFMALRGCISTCSDQTCFWRFKICTGLLQMSKTRKIKKNS